MKIINLNGYSTKNIEDGELISKFLTDKGLKVYNHRWSHWDNPETYMDFEVEIDRIFKEINGEEFIVVAKSIGSVVAATLISQYNLLPKKILLMGLPGLEELYDRTYAYNKAFSNREIPITIIQNNQDPVGGPNNFSKMLKFKYELIVTEGDTHRYVYPGKIFEIISD